MDIYELLPEKNSNWVIKNNIVYFNKGVLIPILKKIDDNWFISLDRRILKKVLLLSNHLTEINHPFFYCDRITINEKYIYNQDLERIIGNYLMCLDNEVFFKFISNSKFDYEVNLTEFLNLYNCHGIFKVVYENCKKSHFLKKFTLWYVNQESYAVENEKIRDYYLNLSRQIKLNVFFSQ
jgi:hypothetical protein